MTDEQRQRLRAIKTFGELTAYLRDVLDWPIEQGHDEDDLTFDWSDDLGLKESERVGIKEIKQLRPLETGQPWGIFFVDFEKKQLPIVILRRILNALVLKKRGSASKAQQAAWKQHDLLFISSFGEDSDRQLTFAYFSEPPNELDDSKATLRVLGWDDNDTNLKLDHVADTLHQKLSWPRDTSDFVQWRKQWAEAFELRHRQVISTAQELALALAELAKRIRNRMLLVLPRESESGELRKLLKGFKTALIHDLDEKTFADMYAQTITYGLFSARVSCTVPGIGTVVDQGTVVYMVHKTNPFLKEMLQSFLKAGGRKGKLDFDELGIQEVVDLLNHSNTHLDAVLRDFGNKRRDEDPVIHFYEDFLKAYDKKLKVQRGVFYTPQPVVSYIVRSVHELLQAEFGLADGLADTATWGDMLKRHPELRLPMLQNDVGDEYPLDENEPFVQILDPATGTATFLVEVIDIICRTLATKWKQQGMNEAARSAAWNDYVPKYLLPRLHAYELMMAPYAIAHMKIGLKLAETGYRFGTEERARIYLTNALEPWLKQLPLVGFDALAHEAAAVNKIKRGKRFTVVIGNPPYSVSSRNGGLWILQLCEKYKRNLEGERNIQPLSDDYIKFIRFAHLVVYQSGYGVIGMITNREYLQGILHRTIREALHEDFTHITLCDLHGQRGEMFPDSASDENVFEIEKGVAIGIYSRIPRAQRIVQYRELIGSSETKFANLQLQQFDEIASASLTPCAPQFFFRPWDSANSGEYQELPSICEFFDRRAVTGFATHRDSFAIGFDKSNVSQRLADFLDNSISDADIQSRFELRDTRDWVLSNARRMARKDVTIESRVIRCAYRPFDIRWVMYSDDVLEYSRREAMQHIGPKSLALICSRIVKDEPYAHVFISNIPIEKIFLSPKSSNNAQVLLTSVARDENSLLDGGEVFRVPQRHAINFYPSSNELLNYIYGVLYSPTYRSRYAEFLKIDFPRLPLTGNLELFRSLAQLGGELIALHLLESPKLDEPITEFIGTNKEVAKVGYADSTVWIDASGSKKATSPGTSGFRGVPEAVWNFHIGGYQVCAKWLKDRKGRTLSPDDIAHYHKIVVALSETIRLMAEIDEVIDVHGGWPAAFSSPASGRGAQPVRYASDGIPNSADEAWTIGLIWHVLREAGGLSHANLREMLSWRANPLPDDLANANASAAWNSLRPSIESRVSAHAAERLDLMLDYLARRNLVRLQDSIVLATGQDLPTDIVVDADTATVAQLLPLVLKGVPQPESDAVPASPSKSKQA